MDVSGTHKQLEVNSDFKTLKKIFGNPNVLPSEKTDTEWHIKTPFGVATLYNYNEDRNTKNWHIGAHNQTAAAYVKGFITKKVKLGDCIGCNHRLNDFVVRLGGGTIGNVVITSPRISGMNYSTLSLWNKYKNEYLFVIYQNSRIGTIGGWYDMTTGSLAFQGLPQVLDLPHVSVVQMNPEIRMLKKAVAIALPKSPVSTNGVNIYGSIPKPMAPVVEENNILKWLIPIGLALAFL